MYNYPVLRIQREMIVLIYGYCQLNLTCHTALFYSYVLRFLLSLRPIQEVIHSISISAGTGNDVFFVGKYIRVWKG